MRKKLIKAIHSSQGGGHSRVQASTHRAKCHFYWPSMIIEIKQAVLECDTCQRCKGEHIAYPGLLQPLLEPQHAWSHIFMDFIEGLPTSGGKNVILVMVDRFTKYGHFLPYSAETVAKLFLDNIYKLHGMLQSIVTDRDKIFTSEFWQGLFKQIRAKLQLSSAYHPQIDGQTEKLNQCLEMYLRCMVFKQPRQWSKWNNLAEWRYNTTLHTSIKMTPFEALYGIQPPRLALGPYQQEAGGKVLWSLQSNLEIGKGSI